jgi:transcription antitermination factor NusB
MGKRREARERAVQFLFQHDLNPPENLDRELNEFWDTQRAAAIAGEKGPATWGQPVELPPPTAEEAEMRLFADPLIRGTLEHRDAIDEHIKKHAKNWEFHRIATVDRNIMRLAIYEMLFREDIPPIVSINEAVDIAKKFSTQDSGKFVNGILDKVRSELMRPARIVIVQMKFADLHLHTNFSDGTFSPEELAGHGQRLGFAALALTDHDSVEGCARMAAACGAAGIEFITGTELTAEHDDTEVHLLGYFLDTQNKTLLVEIAKFQAVRQNRIREMVARINALNIPLEAESVFALANCKSPGRPHVARALVEAGFCKTPDEAFARFLKKNRPGVGAQGQDVRAGRRRIDSPGRRPRGDGASRFEPHG